MNEIDKILQEISMANSVMKKVYQNNEVSDDDVELYLLHINRVVAFISKLKDGNKQGS